MPKARSPLGSEVTLKNLKFKARNSKHEANSNVKNSKLETQELINIKPYQLFEILAYLCFKF